MDRLSGLSKITKLIRAQIHICLAPNPVVVLLLHADMRSETPPSLPLGKGKAQVASLPQGQGVPVPLVPTESPAKPTSVSSEPCSPLREQVGC